MCWARKHIERCHCERCDTATKPQVPRIDLTSYIVILCPGIATHLLYCRTTFLNLEGLGLCQVSDKVVSMDTHTWAVWQSNMALERK